MSRAGVRVGAAEDDFARTRLVRAADPGEHPAQLEGRSRSHRERCTAGELEAETDRIQTGVGGDAAGKQGEWLTHQCVTGAGEGNLGDEAGQVVGVADVARAGGEGELRGGVTGGRAAVPVAWIGPESGNRSGPGVEGRRQAVFKRLQSRPNGSWAAVFAGGGGAMPEAG